MIKKTIIVMEDDGDLRRFICTALELKGYRVIQQENSFGIVSLLEMHQPALVIMDLVMPEFEGFEGILKIVDCCSVPIIAISSFPEYFYLVEQMVARCLIKPLEMSTFLHEVDSVLAGKINQV